MSSPLTYLITGANRGIGKGFTSTYLQRPNTTVIAAVRDPAHATAKALQDLPKAADSKLILVKLDSAVEADAAAAVSTLQSEHGITALDVVIANAGIASGGTTVRKTSIQNTRDTLAVNTLGPIILFQATADLLQASKTGNPRFVAVSTEIGSIGSMDGLVDFPLVHSPYGGSKAALNWFVRRLHFEEPWLTSFMFHPGLVETDMAAGVATTVNRTAKEIGAIPIETSVAGMTAAIDKATKDATSGTFQQYDGKVLPW